MESSKREAVERVRRGLKQTIRRLPGSSVACISALLVFAGVGTLLLTSSHAATPTANTEAESGTLTTPATKVADTNASGGQAVKFGSGVAPTNFAHPGVLLSTTQLNAVKAHIAAHDQPWYNEYTTLNANNHSTRTPHLTKLITTASANAGAGSPVYCDPDNNPANASGGCVAWCGQSVVPDYGCNDELTDAQGAYAEALLYYYTGNVSYAQAAITILNAWSQVLDGHGGYMNPLWPAWVSPIFARTAELVKAEPNTGSQTFDVTAFKSMLNNAFLPALSDSKFANDNGNWDLTRINGWISIAVFEDNTTLFKQSLDQFEARVPAYFYDSALDGALPVPAPNVPNDGSSATTTKLKCFWLAVSGSSGSTCSNIPVGSHFQDGMAQETCRDLNHTTFGVDAAIQIAETARLQGVNLYTGTTYGGKTYAAQGARMADVYENNAHWWSTVLGGQSLSTISASVADMCGTGVSLDYGSSTYADTSGWELGYSALKGQGFNMPYSKSYIDTYIRSPSNKTFQRYNYFIDWETLTSAID